MRFARLWKRRTRAANTPPRLVDPRVTADTHVRPQQVQIGIDAQMPNSMPRSEDDVATRAGSWEFHDRAGSGSHTADRFIIF